MKVIFPLLIALSFPCFAGNASPTALQLLKQDARESNTEIFWDIDTDFNLSEDQLAKLNAVPKGKTVALASTIVEMLIDSGFTEGLEEKDVPVVLFCPEARQLVITQKPDVKIYTACNLAVNN